MNTLKLGVIGCDNRGRTAWLAHKPESGWEISAGADVNRSALAKFKERFPGARTFDDFKELLKCDDICAVFICSPDYCHEEQAIAALESGKAVFLEKPMAITIEGCDRILRTAMTTGSKLFIGHNMRHIPSIVKMKEIVDSGLIGEVRCGWCRHFINYGGVAYFRDWHSERKNSAGLLLQKGSHDIDVMHWIMGTCTKSVVGMGSLSVYDKCARRKPGEALPAGGAPFWPPLEQVGFSPTINVEDHNMVMMQMENGAQACYMQCHFTPDTERNYTFIGTKGRIENVGDFGNCEIHAWTQWGKRETPDIIYRIKKIEGATYETHYGADPLCVQSFLDFVRDGKRPSTSPLAARNAVAVGALGHYSMRNGCNSQQIPSLSPEMVEFFAR